LVLHKGETFFSEPLKLAMQEVSSEDAAREAMPGGSGGAARIAYIGRVGIWGNLIIGAQAAVRREYGGVWRLQATHQGGKTCQRPISLEVCLVGECGPQGLLVATRLKLGLPRDIGCCDKLDERAGRQMFKQRQPLIFAAALITTQQIAWCTVMNRAFTQPAFRQSTESHPDGVSRMYECNIAYPQVLA